MMIIIGMLVEMKNLTCILKKTQTLPIHTVSFLSFSSFFLFFRFLPPFILFFFIFLFLSSDDAIKGWYQINKSDPVIEGREVGEISERKKREGEVKKEEKERIEEENEFQNQSGFLFTFFPSKFRVFPCSIPYFFLINLLSLSLYFSPSLPLSGRQLSLSVCPFLSKQLLNNFPLPRNKQVFIFDGSDCEGRN